MTVGERIRSMSNEELAEFIDKITQPDVASEEMGIWLFDMRDCKSCTESIKKELEELNEDTAQEGIECYGCVLHYLNYDCGVYEYGNVGYNS